MLGQLHRSVTAYGNYFLSHDFFTVSEMIADTISELLLQNDQLQKIINQKQKTIKQLRKTIKQQQEHIDLLNDDIDELTRKPTDEDYDKLLQIIRHQQNTISELKTKISQQQDIINKHIKVTII